MPEWWEKYRLIPYVEKGRDWSGCDCWGLARLVLLTEKGLVLPSYADSYENTDDGRGIASSLDDFLPAWRQLDQPEPFAVALIQWSTGLLHCGIVVHPGLILHAAKGKGVAVERARLLWKNATYHAPICTA